jgi:hypothetical protein
MVPRDRLCGAPVVLLLAMVSGHQKQTLSVTTTTTTGDTIFVSTSTGDDRHNGQTNATAVRTLRRAAALISSPTPPTALLLRCGDTFSDELFLANVSALFIGAFGDPGDPRPMLWRNNYSVGLSAITLVDTAAIVVSGLDIGRSFFGIRVLFHRADGPSLVPGPTVIDCVLRDVLGTEGRACLQHTGCWATAIHVGRTSVNASVVAVQNLTITGTVAVNCDAVIRNGAAYHSVVTGVLLDGMVIRGSTMYQCHYNVVELIENTASVIEGCVFYRDGRDPTLPQFVGGTTDIIIGTVHGNTIRNNDFVLRGELGSAPDGCAIDFETDATATTVAGNYISSSFGAGVMVYGHSNGSNTGLLLDGNILIHDGCGQPRADHGAVAFVHIESSGRLENNVFVPCANKSIPIFNDVNPNASMLWVHTNDTFLTASQVAEEVVLTSKLVGACAVISVGGKPSESGGVPSPTVRYTVDGSVPTKAAPPVVHGTVTLCRSGVLNAKRFGPVRVSSSTTSIWVSLI